jgi:oligopeptide/dipeptide ABC transporter ATP-binding protein
LDSILSVRDLSVSYYTPEGESMAVRNVSLEVKRGETIGIVGESGSGKSTLGLAIMRLIHPPGKIKSGSIYYEGSDILSMRNDELRKLRGKEIAMIFQDPMSSLNPVKKVRDHFTEYIMQHVNGISYESALKRAKEMLRNVGISEERIEDYPHQFSGGMRQRVMIALALTLNPKLLIADEPTTALDVLVEAQILELINRLKKEFSLTVILITHNMGVVAEMADRVAVMYAGKIVELSETKNLYENPRHPYTMGLIQSIPLLHDRSRKLLSIPGHPPDLRNIPQGCSFNPRCPYAFDKCRVVEPELERKEGERYVACHLY